MNDLISRSAAINAIDKCTNIFVGDMPILVDKSDVYEAIAALPSAQSYRDNCVERYEDLIEYFGGENYVLKNRKEFKAWLERGRWHVIECDKLARQLDKQQWISCSERMPEEEKKTYWVCTDAGSQHECRWTNNRFGLGEGSWGWSIFDIPQYTSVVAWRGLPEPYKGEV